MRQLSLSRRVVPFALLFFPPVLQAQDPIDDRAREWAESVTIIRDVFGVPHVYGATDAAVVFGYAYAQAEDALEQVEDNILRSLGRASEVYGEAQYEFDLATRALRIPQLAKAEYLGSDPRMKEIYEAFASGLNYYVRSKQAHLALLERFEPWHSIAFLRFNYYVREFLGYAGVDLSQLDVSRTPRVELGSTGQVRADSFPEPITGSNMWAVAPSKTVEGNAMLFINPHVSFFGTGLYYEGHLVSEEGWNLSGVGRYGFPFPYIGHNEHLGWSHTDNYHDHGDLYEITFDDPNDPLAYRYDGGYRRAEEWTEIIGVLTDGQVVETNVTLTATHHGPIVASRKGIPLAVRLAKIEEGGWYDQWYNMGKASNLDEFQSAVSQHAIPYMNIMYADDAGNIYYIYNGVIARRNENFDWALPVDGGDPRAEWDGFHSYTELPQVLNPSSGWLLNTNSTPMTVTDSTGYSREDFPSYMVGNEVDNPRARASRRLLANEDKFDFESWTRAATDTYVVRADSLIGEMVVQWENLSAVDPTRAARLRVPVELLQNWNRISTVESSAMSLLALSFAMAPFDPSRSTLLDGLDSATTYLLDNWGTVEVGWGELNRHQRPNWRGDEGFSDDAPSTGIPGVPGWLGAVYTYYSAPRANTYRFYGRAGNSFVSVVEFGERIRARSILFFGESTDPDSPHFDDQVELYSQGRFKTAWFYREDVERNAERTYRPSDQ